MFNGQGVAKPKATGDVPGRSMGSGQAMGRVGLPGGLPGGLVGAPGASSMLGRQKGSPAAIAARAGRPGGLGPLGHPTSQNKGFGNLDLGGGLQVEEHHMVFAFLKDLGLEQFGGTLLQSGFDDMETLFAIEDADMKDLGIPPLYALKLRRRLQEVQRQSMQAGRPFDDSHPVVQFLDEVGLPQYAQLLLRSGFDDMETLPDIEDADLKDLGIPRGHALKLKKRLREHQLQQYAKEEEMPIHVIAHQQVFQVRTPVRRPGQIPSSAIRAMPTEQMKSAVEQSWEHVQALGTYSVGEILYRNTFAIMPEAIHLFPSHVRMKYREWSPDEGIDELSVYESPSLRKLFSKFINAIGCAVAGIHDSNKLVPMLTQLGARHINYGVSEAHWQAMGKALNATLREILGVSFTAEVEGAWSMAYSFMSSIMMEGLRSAIAARDAALSAAQSGKLCEHDVDRWSEGSTSLTRATTAELMDMARQESSDVPDGE